MYLVNLPTWLLLAALHWGSTVSGSPSVTHRGTFQDPPILARPKFRYWIPDASVDHDIAASDIRAAAEAGAGGLEALGFYLYGGPPANAGRGTAAPVSWATYGFGTDAWNSLFRDLLRAHKESGIVMDFAMGPNQGTGVPAPSDSDGLMWDLDAYNVTVPIGGTFDDRLPGWGAGVLQAAVTGLVIRSEQATGVEPGLPGDPAASRTQHTLSTESLQVVTDRVDKNGRLRIEFDPRAEGLHHVVFAVYLQHSLYRAQDGPLDIGGPQTPATTLAGNGSWAVDHFSRRGAETTIGFWEKHILPNGTLELLAEAGNYGWEDSVEIQSNIYWTKDFLDIFQKEHGYSIARWLPLLFHRNGNGRNSAYPVWWITDEPDNGTSHIADYRTTLGKQYDDYISTLNAWVKSRLGLHFSAQVAYQLPMDMMPNIPSVDIPECETLDFEDLIDGYRLYSGPATLGNRNIISSECGAVHGEVFAQMWPELLWHVKRSYAGSVNQFVLHGFPYTGNYGNTTWPVYTTFNYQYSAMHGPRDPAWAFYRDYLDYIARNNYILQQGTPKMDVAIWQKNTVYPKHVKIRRYEPADLERAGYTYEYLSPDNFDLPSATVRDGVLAPDAQGFKALVVRANDTLTIDGVSKLVGFAQAHLPIVFLGGLPSTYLGTNKAEAVRASQSALKKITTLSNVHVTDSYDGLASVLASIGIQPAARFVTDAPNWYTLRRVDSQSHSEYYFVYNDAPGVPRGTGKAKATVQFQSSGVPYKLDAWTGEETPILTYTRSGSSTSIPITLAGNQTTLVVFRAEGGYATQQHVADVSAEVLGLSALKNGSVALHVGPKSASSPSSSPSFTSADGRQERLASAAPSARPIVLHNWTLTVEHWDPPSDLYDIEGGSVRHNTTHNLPYPVSWQEVPGLQNVSGRGYYAAAFRWPPAASSCGARAGHETAVDGAVVDFGFVAHTLRASVNGHPLPPLDVTSPRADIGPYLVRGENMIEAVVATPLGNVVRTVWDRLETSGTKADDPVAGGGPPGVADYGLLANVTVTPYRTVVVA